ncbi:MAG TPA: hypothetical protein VFX47_07850 [Gammaproteobacteria bacterium]|nr:hypothetical protein [Gammaproteobacteria bacterium]
MADQGSETKFELDLDNLYREEVFTDQKIGSLRQMTPVKKDGSADNSRPMLFVGETSLLTPAGSLPINFKLEAKTLVEALDKFTGGANQAIQDTMEQLRELRRQSASSIVVPDLKGGGLGGLGGAGGGKIQIP